MPEVISQLPPMTIPMVDKSGQMTLAWRRFFESQWLRSGGFQDFIYAAFLAANTGDATLAELSASSDIQQRQIADLRSLIQASIGDDLIQSINDLQRDLANLRAQVSGIRGEDAAATITQVQVTISSPGSAPFGGVTTTNVPEGTNLYFTTGRVTSVVSGTYATISSLNSLASSISTVGYSGAYADLTGKPTLGTASSQNTGTSGGNVPLLNGTNTWSSRQTFSTEIAQGAYTAGVAVQAGTLTIRDSSGTLRTLLTA